jgi:hypothetical protein
LGGNELAQPSAFFHAYVRDLKHYSGLRFANDDAAAQVTESSLYFENSFAAELAASAANGESATERNAFQGNRATAFRRDSCGGNRAPGDYALITALANPVGISRREWADAKVLVFESRLQDDLPSPFGIDALQCLHRCNAKLAWLRESH